MSGLLGLIFVHKALEGENKPRRRKKRRGLPLVWLIMFLLLIGSVFAATTHIRSSGTSTVNGNLSVSGAISGDIRYLMSFNGMRFVDEGNASDIQVALDACGGCDVIIPRGYYEVSSTINVPAETTLHMQRGATLNVTANVHVFNLSETAKLGDVYVNTSSVAFNQSVVYFRGNNRYSSTRVDLIEATGAAGGNGSVILFEGETGYNGYMAFSQFGYIEATGFQYVIHFNPGDCSGCFMNSNTFDHVYAEDVQYIIFSNGTLAFSENKFSWISYQDAVDSSGYGLIRLDAGDDGNRFDGIFWDLDAGEYPFDFITADNNFALVAGTADPCGGPDNCSNNLIITIGKPYFKVFGGGFYYVDSPVNASRYHAGPGTQALPAYTFEADEDTGIFQTQPGRLTIGINNDNDLEFQAATMTVNTVMALSDDARVNGANYPNDNVWYMDQSQTVIWRAEAPNAVGTPDSLIVATDLVYANATLERVGIETNEPLETLHVNGSTRTRYLNVTQNMSAYRGYLYQELIVDNIDGVGGTMCVGVDCSAGMTIQEDLVIFDSHPTLLFEDGSGTDFEVGADAGILFFRVEDQDNNMTFDGSNLNVTGNIKANEFYAETYLNETTTITIGLQSIYHNVTVANYTMDFANGFNFSNGVLRPTVNGVFDFSHTQAFSGGISDLIHFTLTHNEKNMSKCEAHRKLGTGGDTGSSAGGCTLRVSSGDRIRAVVMNSDAAVDIELEHYRLTADWKQS